jgi:hypothetical protein
MTVLVAVRTGSSAILAADSKLTTQAYVGTNPDGSPRYAPQTYDHALKIAQDLSSTAIAAFAGYANIGVQNAVDYFGRLDARLHVEPEAQDGRVRELVDGMVEERRKACEVLKIPFEQASFTVALLAAPPLQGTAPRFWRILLEGNKGSAMEVLKNAGTWIEGDAGMTLTLLYGLNDVRVLALREKLKIDENTFQKAVEETVDLAAVNGINFWTMPVQDAMDFAVFCARVQVEMDRFLPGLGSCGGPIDLMTLEMAPKPHVRSFPGKRLHHPDEGLG